MGFLFLLSSLLLLPLVAPITEVPRSSCSSQLKAETQHHFNTSGIHLTLHHPRSPCSPAALPHLPYSAIFDHDNLRVDSLASRLKPRSSSRSKPSLTPSTVTVPLTPGTSIGVGNYITKIGIGTPPTSYVMVVDTGSSLSWLQCSPCKVSCHAQVGQIYDPTASTSYRSVSCSTPECNGLQSATLNPSGCSRSNVCVYQASYGDSSFSVGYLSKDTLTLQSQMLPGFIYGCGQDNEGLFGQSAGLIGLAKNKLSLLYQLASKTGSTAFSYCLPSSGSSGYLSFGPYASSSYVFTPMVTNSLDGSLYFLKLTGVTVAGKGLAVSPSSYTSTPTIIDSGTVISRLPSDVYSALSKAVAAALRRYPRAPAYSILDTCFKGSVNGIKVPEVAMVFAGGAAVKLPAKNVLLDVDSSTTCLAFAPAGSVAIIGNRQQQTFRVVYDVAKAKIGFAAGGCG